MQSDFRLITTLEELDHKLSALCGGLETAAVCAEEYDRNLRHNSLYQHIECLRMTAGSALTSVDEAQRIERERNAMNE